MACNTCGGIKSSDIPNYSVEKPAIATGKPLTALEIVQGIKVIRTKNDVQGADTKNT